MPDKTNDTIIATVMEQLMAEGPQAMAQIISALMNLAMRMEREQFLGAGHYERAPSVNGGVKSGHGAARLCQWYQTQADRHARRDAQPGGAQDHRDRRAVLPASAGPRLAVGRRSCRAVMLAVAEMYVCGVSTRDAERVMAEFGLKSLSSTQVSRAAKLLDEEFEAWRRRQLGEIHYLPGRPLRKIAARRRGA
jgi:putative transposase